MAIEDRRFFQHGGVDYQGILRAGIRTCSPAASSIQGGSTLTMQLVDNVYLPSSIRQHHDLKYKIMQAKLAQQLEKRPQQEWILDQYLNDVQYGTVGGETAIGVGAASQMFFDKPVSRLDLAQVALLAGLPQAPSEYNPFVAPGLARRAATRCSRRWWPSHYITPEQAIAPSTRRSRSTEHAYSTRPEPFVFDYVKQQLIQKLGAKTVENGGLKVYTTINPTMQQQARAAIAATQPTRAEPRAQPAAALVTIDPANGRHPARPRSTAPTPQTNFDYAGAGRSGRPGPRSRCSR